MGAAAHQNGITFLGVVELVRFLQMRQTIGYRLANEVVAIIGDRLLAHIPGATLARTGRTRLELLFNAPTQAAAGEILAAVRKYLCEPVTVAGLQLTVDPVIGYSPAEEDSISDELIDRVSTALAVLPADQPKVVYAQASEQDFGVVADIELLRELRASLTNGTTEVHYQPKLSLRSDTIEAAEALFRWTPSSGRPVPIERLLKLVEGSGMMRELTFWVLDRVIADGAALQAQGRKLQLFVNISAPLVADPAFVAELIARTKASSTPIGLEITETAVIDDPELAIENLRLLASEGIRVAIDDYGTGLSSLAYLKQLPVQELKIDRMFIAGLTESNRDPLIVRSSIDLAHAMEMEVTAEGVDNLMALALLRVMGCDTAQGFLISPALPLAELITFLKDDAHRSAAIGGLDSALPLRRLKQQA